MKKNLAAARAARDEGIETVLSNEEAKESIRGVIRALKEGWEGTGEDIRIRCCELGFIPHHPNAWGGIVNGMIKQGWLEKTGEYRQMETPRSHARETAVLRRTNLEDWSDLI